MVSRPLVRPQYRPSLRGAGVASGGGSSGGVNLPGWVQQVVDPGFASPGSWTFGGTGIGTTAVTGGVLQVTSVDNAYTVRGALLTQPLDPGVYTTTFTVLNYVSGAIGTVFSLTTTLIGGTFGTARSANGTYTETVTLPAGGYIGLAGEGSAVVNNLQVDNFTILRAA